MYCPKCGIESPEGHRFCKTCGANLQLVSDAMEGKQIPLVLGQLGIDVERLRRGARNVARNIQHGKEARGDRSTARSTAQIERETRREARRQRERLPRPKEWLRYSWQHNLRDGLMSVFGGAGLGAVLYFVSNTLSDMGLLHELETQSHVHGLEAMARLLWLFAAIPVLKGLGQILYAAFFAESIATLSERFIPTQQQQQQAQIEAIPTNFIPAAAPPSVTEQTTNILEKEGALHLKQEAERVAQ